MPHILVIDDDPDIGEAVRARLMAEGYEVTLCADARSGIEQHRTTAPDLVVLDLGLPDLDGLEVCRRLQAVRPTAVLMLTARDDEADVVLGLEVGADDYLTKPFSHRELTARVRAIVRRNSRSVSADSPAPPLVVGDVVVDVARRTVSRRGTIHQLTATEFDLVAFLVARPGVVHSRIALLTEVWGYRDGSGARTVDSHVRAVRRKLGDDVVRTVHGVGYAFGLES